MLVPLSSYQSLSQNPGIYLFLGRGGEVLYVGKAKNLKNRVASYFSNYIALGIKTRVLVSQIKKIKAIYVASELEALLLEANYIKKLQPKYNIRLTDGKAYPLIRITIKDKYPKVLIARKMEDNPPAGGSIYFGPFPNSGALRMVLKLTRKIFPYQSVLNHTKKICLYYHLGLCPCPAVFDSKILRKDYRKNIKHLISFLSGATRKVIRDLEKERDILSRTEEFEKAQLFQNKINAINIITDPFYKNRFDKDIDPNLESDLRTNELLELETILTKHGMKIQDLKRIECYDISNISGTNATGSMIVFTDGSMDKASYRRFRIKIKNTPDDFAMLSEVIQRRMRHAEWPYPDLIIVDGGKGQVGAALKAMKQSASPAGRSNNTIPVIGLAKREEIIITSELKEIILPKDSKALSLVMRIRDEAHRFAVNYHRLLRSKTALK